MKRIMFALIVGVMLTGATAFAADGDLQVNGDLIAKGVIVEVLNASPTTDIQTSSTTFVDMQGMSINVTNDSNRDYTLLILWNTTICGGGNAAVVTEAQVDGASVGATQGGAYSSATVIDPVGGHAVKTVGTGSHTVKIRWRATGGTVYNLPTQNAIYGRTLTVMVIRQ